MKRSSVILLWISFLGTSGLNVVQVIGAVTIYRLFHPVLLEQFPNGMPAAEVADFAGGTVIHVSSGISFVLLPFLNWFVVWFTDRGALKMWLGRAATWSALIYLLFGFAMMFWLQTIVTA